MKKTIRTSLFTLLLLGLTAAARNAQFPELNIIYPPTDQFECASNQLPVTGSIQCPGCLLTIQNKTIAVHQDGSFEFQADIRPGQQTITVRLDDKKGNQLTKNLYINNTLATSRLPLPAPLPAINTMIPQPPVNIGNQPAPTSDKKFTPTVSSEPAHSKQEKPQPRQQSALQIVHNGKTIANLGHDEYVQTNNRVFIDIASKIWPKSGARSNAKSRTLDFSATTNNIDTTISFDKTDISPPPIESQKGYFVPIRATCEKAGYIVHWQPGRIYLSGPANRPAEAKFQNKISVRAYIKTNSLFIQSVDLNKFGLKTSRETGDNIRISDRNGNWLLLSIDRGAFSIRTKTGGSKTTTLLSPQNAVAKPEFSIPLRTVMAEFGFSVRWDSARKTAHVTPS